MNIRNNILLSLMIGSLAFPAMAQKSEQQTHPVSPEPTVQPVSPELTVQPVSPEPTVQPVAQENDPQPTSDTTEPADVTEPALLQLKLEGNALRVCGGEGDQFAILLGLQKKTFPLPDGAQLLLDPLMILVQGELDEDGEYEISADTEEDYAYIHEPIKFYAQAIAVSADTGAFRSSTLLELEFDGVTISWSNEETEGVAMVQVPSWIPEAQKAIRRQMVA